MTSQSIFEICSNIIIVSITGVIATGSLLLICGMLMVLFNKDADKF